LVERFERNQNDVNPAFQLRRYGWTTKLSLLLKVLEGETQWESALRAHPRVSR